MSRNKPEEFKNEKTKNHEFLHLVADIGVIVSSVLLVVGLILSVLFFYSQIKIQKENELNEHISNIKSLETELEKNMELLDNIIKKKELLGEKLFFGELILENVKRSVSDGKISNNIIKSNVIAREFEALEINNLISFINSPDFSTDSTTHNLKRNLVNQLVNKTLEIYKPHFQETYNLVTTYEVCLNNEKNIKLCNEGVIYIKR